MIGIIIVALAFLVAIYLITLENKTWERVFRDYTRQLQEKQGIRRREIIFVEEEELGAEHAGLVVSDIEEEEEALYWS